MCFVLLCSSSACTDACAVQNLACRWGLGPMAQKKKQLVAAGKLDKFGRPNETTPKVMPGMHVTSCGFTPLTQMIYR